MSDRSPERTGWTGPKENNAESLRTACSPVHCHSKNCYSNLDDCLDVPEPSDGPIFPADNKKW